MPQKPLPNPPLPLLAHPLHWGDVNWVLVISSAVLAGILSLLTIVVGLPEVKEDEADV